MTLFSRDVMQFALFRRRIKHTMEGSETPSGEWIVFSMPHTTTLSNLSLVILLVSEMEQFAHRDTLSQDRDTLPRRCDP